MKFLKFCFSLSQINQFDEAIYNYHKAISLKEDDFDSLISLQNIQTNKSN